MSEINSFKTSISQDVYHPASEIGECGNLSNSINTGNTKMHRSSIPAIGEKNEELKNIVLKEDSCRETELLHDCINHLTNEVNEAKMNLEETKNGFKTIMFEMERQLEVANQREVKAHTRYLLLQIEKEKLTSLLSSKSNLILKLKKELISARKIIKFVNKRLQCFFNLPENVFDLDYAEFESGLNNESSKLLSTKDTIDVINDSTTSSDI